MDTTWKFRDMIAFRDNVVSKYGLSCCPHQPGWRQWRGITFDSPNGSAKYTDLMKTDALARALDLYGFDAAFGGARAMKKNPAPKAGVLVPATKPPLGPENQRPELGMSTTAR